MASKSLDDLGLVDEPLPAQALDDLPEFGGFAELPQPGTYGFRLPPSLAQAWDTVETQEGTRVQVIFDRDYPLTIVEAPTHPRSVGERFDTRLSNVKRPRGRDKSVIASDMDYLLKAFGAKSSPTGNRGYIEALNTHVGKTFHAEVTYSYICNANRDIYVVDASGKNQKVEGTKGCGKRYYQRDVPKVNGEYPQQLACECGAVLRPFANLDNIRS